eukprot:10317454-Alexandrium_andersonii.AAC.1
MIPCIHRQVPPHVYCEESAYKRIGLPGLGPKKLGATVKPEMMVQPSQVPDGQPGETPGLLRGGASKRRRRALAGGSGGGSAGGNKS